MAIIGGDRRLEYLAAELQNEDFEVSCFATAELFKENEPDLDSAIVGAGAVILPFPLSPDGVYLSAVCDACHITLTDIFDCAKRNGVKSLFAGAIKDDIHRLCAERGLTLTDYSLSESFLLRNALCTAEGALSIIMKELDRTVFGARFTVVGYGRIGSMLAKMLSVLGGKVSCAARNPDVRALIELNGLTSLPLTELSSVLASSDAVINTVPAAVLDGDSLSLVSDGAVIIDLASSPGGIDFDAAERLGKRVIWARSLPGKYSPRTASEIIKDSILSLIRTSEADQRKE